MGIKGLGPLIPQKARGEIKFKYLKGKKIAIDISVVEHRNKYGAYNHEYRKKDNIDEDIDEDLAETRFHALCVELALNLLSYGILPVFVFDGERRPEKKGTNNKRKEDRKNTKKKIKSLKKKMNKEGSTKDTREEYYRLKSRKEVTMEDNNNLKTILEYIGFPCLTATYDAEKLCTMLCLEKKVDAVYSSDYDNLAMCCPFLLTKHLTKREKGKQVRYFEYVQHKHIRKSLELSRKQFLQFCIMCGTDFNDNIPDVGPVKALKYIKNNKKYIDKHNKLDLESIEETYGEIAEDFMLKYEDSLRILSREKSEDCCIGEIDIKLNIDLELIRERLSEYSLSHLTDKVVDSLERYNILVNG